MERILRERLSRGASNLWKPATFRVTTVSWCTFDPDGCRLRCQTAIAFCLLRPKNAHWNHEHPVGLAVAIALVADHSEKHR